MHYTYIIRCSDDSLYTGYTTDVGRRIKEHNNQNGAKYTRGRTPVVLEYVEISNDRSSAMQREYHIKQMSRNRKEDLLVDSGVRIKFNL